ncbi:MAG: peptidase M22 [Pelagibacteraceae bacterium]|nr:peptidase M22 [Pelagibacteraceae bacterium]|tara:strand:- start:12 stop:395 length:384 start_codon:yes stop_codon:yes gene_type:complete
MINDFMILNCIGKDDKIGLRINENFYIHEIDYKINKNDLLVLNILNLVKKYKVNLDKKFSIIVNIGPGSFSTIRSSLSIAKGMKISKKINLYVYKNSDLDQFDLANIELLICKGLIQNKLIKPIYLS